MSTNHTEYYQLSLWDEDDQVLRTEFNENHQKLDTALHGVAEEVTELEGGLAGITGRVAGLEGTAASVGGKVTALEGRVAAVEDNILIGSFMPDGTTGAQFIPLPFTPRLVIVSGKKELNNYFVGALTIIFGEYAHQFFGEGNGPAENTKIVEGGFQLWGYCHNDPNIAQRYVAIR